jgi:CheY-like chemotaxis protein
MTLDWMPAASLAPFQSTNEESASKSSPEVATVPKADMSALVEGQPAELLSNPGSEGQSEGGLPQQLNHSSLASTPAVDSSASPAPEASMLMIRVASANATPIAQPGKSAERSFVAPNSAEPRRDTRQIVNVECRVQVLSETAWLRRQAVDTAKPSSQPLELPVESAKQSSIKKAIPAAARRPERKQNKEARFRRKTRKPAARAADKEPSVHRQEFPRPASGPSLTAISADAALSQTASQPAMETPKPFDNAVACGNPISPDGLIASDLPTCAAPAETSQVDDSMKSIVQDSTTQTASPADATPIGLPETEVDLLMDPAPPEVSADSLETCDVETPFEQPVFPSGMNTQTEFTLDLNAPTSTAEHAGNGSGLIAEPSAPSQRPLRRVLVVDDDPVIRMLLGMGLEHYGYECVTAEHGKAAQAILQSDSFDLLVVDLLMPVMDGLAFIRWLRMTAMDATPVLVFTNVDDLKIAREAVACGANALAGKPMPLRELVAAMNSLIPVETVQD